MNFEIWLTYFFAVCILSISPGAGAVNTMSTSLRYGFRSALPAIAGLQSGLALDILLVGAGLGALVATSATAFAILKWLGVAYLVCLAFQKFFDRGTFELSSSDAPRPSSLRLFSQATLVNLTNPKAIVFLVALFPQFIDPTRPQMNQFLLLGGTLIVVDIFVMIGYATLARSLRYLVRNERAMRFQNRIFGAMFLGAGALLASVKS